MGNSVTLQLMTSAYIRDLAMLFQRGHHTDRRNIKIESADDVEKVERIKDGARGKGVQVIT
jgi:hypothetical protein